MIGDEYIMNRCIGIIENICRENNIELKKFSKDWVLSLEKNGKKSYIVGYKFDLNSRSYNKDM